MNQNPSSQLTQDEQKAHDYTALIYSLAENAVLTTQLALADIELKKADESLREVEAKEKQLAIEREALNNELEAQKSLYNTITSLLTEYKEIDLVEVKPEEALRKLLGRHASDFLDPNTGE